MSIKFRCPECQGKIRVAEEFGGKRGKCPTCQRFVDIPLSSTIPDDKATEEAKKASAVAEAKKESAVAEAQGAPEEAQGAPEAKEAPDAGKGSGQARSVWVEKETAAEEPAAPAAPATKESSGSQKPTAATFIRFNCPNCEKPTGFPANLAGSPATCPLCGVRIMVPETTGAESFVVGALPPGARVAPRSPALRPSPPADAAPAAAPAAPAGSPPWVLIVLGVAALIVIAVLAGVLIGRGTAPETKTAAAPTPPAVTPVPQPVPHPLPQRTVEPAQNPPDAASLEALAELAKKALQANTPAKPAEPTATETPKEQPKPEEKPAAETKTTPPAIPTEMPKATRKDDEEEVVGKKETAKKEEGANAVDQPPAKQAEPATLPAVTPPPPGPLCAQCLGTGYAPLSVWQPYVYLFGERPPDPMLTVPWNYCPKCQKDKNNKDLLLAETDRRLLMPARNKYWDELGGKDVKFYHLETHNVCLHCDAQIPPAAGRNVAMVLEKLSGQLQVLTRSTLLTQARPSTHELVLIFDEADYNSMITALEKKEPGEDWGLSRKSTGFSSRLRGVYQCQKCAPPGPEPMAIHMFGKMLMLAATDGKAPAWLTEGFTAYCENLMTKRNLCYSFSYEKNDVKFGENWNQEIRKYAMQGKLKTWDTIFMTSLIGQKAVDYLTFYSMVCFLMSDPQKFCVMVAELREGADSAKAIEKAYGLPIKDLQMRWAQWAVAQR